MIEAWSRLELARTGCREKEGGGVPVRGAILRPSLGGRFGDSKILTTAQNGPRALWARFRGGREIGSCRFDTDPKRARFSTPFLHTSTCEVCVLGPPRGGWGGYPRRQKRSRKTAFFERWLAPKNLRGGISRGGLPLGGYIIYIALVFFTQSASNFFGLNQTKHQNTKSQQRSYKKWRGQDPS